MAKKEIVILGINASPRSNSNSRLFLDYVVNAIDFSPDYTVNSLQVDLKDLSIDCLGCEACYENLKYHQDGISDVCEKMQRADIILYSNLLRYASRYR